MKYPNLFILWFFVCLNVISCSHKEQEKPSYLLLKDKKSQKDSVEKDKDVTYKAVFKMEDFLKPPTGEQTANTPFVLPSSSTSNQTVFKDVGYYRNRGRQYLLSGEYPLAEDDFLEAMRLDPKNMDAYLGLAMVKLRQDDFRMTFHVLEQLQELIEKSPFPTDELYLQHQYLTALTHFKHGSLKEGRHVLVQLLRFKKDFVPAYKALASSYLDTQDTQLASFVIQRGLDACSDQPEFYDIMGVIALKNGLNEHAHTHFEKALSLDPNYIGALINEAHLFILRKDYQRATGNLVKVLEQTKGLPQPYILLGISKSFESSYKEAQVMFEKALALDPKNAVARYNMSLTAFLSGEKGFDSLRLLHEVQQIVSLEDPLYQLSADLMGTMGQNLDKF